MAKRETKNQQMVFRLEGPTYRALQKYAKEHNLSMARVIRDAINQFLDTQELTSKK